MAGDFVHKLRARRRALGGTSANGPGATNTALFDVKLRYINNARHALAETQCHSRRGGP